MPTDRPFSVAVIAYGGFVSDDIAGWLLAESRRGLLGGVHFVDRFDVVCARNAACERFLNGDGEILIQIDHDLLPGRSGFHLADLGEYDVMTARYGGPMGEYHKTDHAEGLMAIRRRVLVGLTPPWFPPVKYTWTGSDHTACEGKMFFDRVREAGFKIGRWPQGVGHRHLHEYPAPHTTVTPSIRPVDVSAAT